MDLTSIMTTRQTQGLHRNTIDKFYTKPTTVEMCIGLVKQYIVIDPNDLIIEPSAGNGSFITFIHSLSCRNVYCFDIEPEHDSVLRQDYLLYDIRPIRHTFRNIHVIGNPPFGRQSSLAIRFIKKSCEFCTTFSFILPKSFKKDSVRKKIPLQFHLVVETDLPSRSFLIDDNEHHVETVFQIWERRDGLRTLPFLETPRYFVFVRKDGNPDISFRRVGVRAGRIDTTIHDKSPQSHYFIKFTNGRSVDDNIRSLQSLQFYHNNTVGPRSISKQELVQGFNKCLL